MGVNVRIVEPELPLGVPVQKDLAAEFGTPCLCSGKVINCHSCGGTGITVEAKGFFKKLQKL